MRQTRHVCGGQDNHRGGLNNRIVFTVLSAVCYKAGISLCTAPQYRLEKVPRAPHGITQCSKDIDSNIYTVMEPQELPRTTHLRPDLYQSTNPPYQGLPGRACLCWKMVKCLHLHILSPVNRLSAIVRRPSGPRVRHNPSTSENLSFGDSWPASQ